MIDTAMIKGAERIVERHRLFARRAAARTERDG
jgi:hypothetical protein